MLNQFQAHPIYARIATECDLNSPKTNPRPFLNTNPSYWLPRFFHEHGHTDTDTDTYTDTDMDTGTHIAIYIAAAIHATSHPHTYRFCIGPYDDEDCLSVHTIAK